jgi:hypothetical protein
VSPASGRHSRRDGRHNSSSVAEDRCPKRRGGGERESEGEGGEKEAPGPGRACSRLPLGVDLRAMPALHVNTRGALTVYMVSERETLGHWRPAPRRAARAVSRLARPRPIYRTAGLDVLSLRFSPVSLVRTCIWLNTAGGANTGAVDRAPARARRGRDGPLRRSSRCARGAFPSRSLHFSSAYALFLRDRLRFSREASSSRAILSPLARRSRLRRRAYDLFSASLVPAMSVTLLALNHRRARAPRRALAGRASHMRPTFLHIL